MAALDIDREFEFYDYFFSFLKFNEFYEFLSVEKIAKNRNFVNHRLMF